MPLIQRQAAFELEAVEVLVMELGIAEQHRGVRLVQRSSASGRTSGDHRGRQGAVLHPRKQIRAPEPEVFFGTDVIVVQRLRGVGVRWCMGRSIGSGWGQRFGVGRWLRRDWSLVLAQY